MLEDLERDTCNFLMLTLESLTGAWDEIQVTPIAQGKVTLFRIELESESLTQFLANNPEMLQAIQILVSTRGMRQSREFRIEFGGRVAGAPGD
jgi:predicted RNA-binding protein YlqC (UPF0109 family)